MDTGRGTGVMEILRSPRSDVETYERGWQLSIHAGLRVVALGYQFARYPSEWTFSLMVGPVSFTLWRPKP